jgi:hypothetical protein
LNTGKKLSQFFPCDETDGDPPNPPPTWSFATWAVKTQFGSGPIMRERERPSGKKTMKHKKLFLMIA